VQQSQIYVPPLSYVNKILIISVAVIFLIQNIVGKIWGVPLEVIFGLSPGKFFGGHIYQIVTYPFMGRGLMEVLFNGLLLWFIGSDLENIWGRTRYIKFFFVCILGAGLIYMGIGLLFLTKSPLYFFPLMGMAGFINFLMLAYAILYPDRLFTFMFLFPIKAKYFCMLIIGIELFMGFFSPAGASSFAHLGAMGTGYIYMLFLSSPRLKRYFKRVPKKKKKSSHLYLVKGLEEDEEDDEGPGKGKNGPPKYWQ